MNLAEAAQALHAFAATHALDVANWELPPPESWATFEHEGEQWRACFTRCELEGFTLYLLSVSQPHEARPSFTKCAVIAAAFFPAGQYEQVADEFDVLKRSRKFIARKL